MRHRCRRLAGAGGGRCRTGGDRTRERRGADGRRTILLEKFFTLPNEGSIRRENVLKNDEIITEVFVPKLAPNTGAAYIKFLPRTADDYATVSAAAVLTLDKSKKNIADVRIALGSVGVTPIRATAAEAVLRGQPLKAEALAEAGEKAKEAVDPVSDFRGSAAYKKDMAAVFVRRALEKALVGIRQQARAKAAPKPAKRKVAKKKGRRR